MRDVEHYTRDVAILPYLLLQYSAFFSDSFFTSETRTVIVFLITCTLSGKQEVVVTPLNFLKKKNDCLGGPTISTGHLPKRFWYVVVTL